MTSGGKPVSHIKVVYNHLLIHGARVKVASIGGVCTHPEFRGRGAATALLDRCMAEATEAGATVLIISGGRGLYRRAQAVDAGRTFRARISPDSIGRADGACTIRPATPDDWGVVARLYQQEPVRFVRSADFVASVVSHRHHGRLWIVESTAGDVLAYVTLGRDWGERHDAPRRLVGEYAGSRAALVQALPAIIEASELELITFDFPADDRELAYLFAREGVGMKPSTIKDHTMRLLNLPELMRRLKPYTEARLARSDARKLSFRQGEECVFGCGSEEARFDVGRATALVLGGPEASRVGGELGRLLSSIYPIPLPLPGMNYV